MSIEKTFVMIKPDALRRNITGIVVAYFEEEELEVAAQKMIRLTQERAAEFYAEHKERPFFAALVQNITEGPVIPMVLKGENAIARAREIIGATNPAEAAENTIRGDLGESLDFNTVHGSDSPKAAEREISFFFTKDEILK